MINNDLSRKNHHIFGKSVSFWATLTSVAKQAKTAFLHGPTVWKSPIVGIEPATFRSESAALTTAPRDPTQDLLGLQRRWCARSNWNDFLLISILKPESFKIQVRFKRFNLTEDAVSRGWGTCIVEESFEELGIPDTKWSTQKEDLIWRS